MLIDVDESFDQIDLDQSTDAIITEMSCIGAYNFEYNLNLCMLTVDALGRLIRLAGKGLTSWLSFMVSSVSLSLSHWYPGSGVVLDCIDS